MNEAAYRWPLTLIALLTSIAIYIAVHRTAAPIRPVPSFDGSPFTADPVFAAVPLPTMGMLGLLGLCALLALIGVTIVIRGNRGDGDDSDDE